MDISTFILVAGLLVGDLPYGVRPVIVPDFGERVPAVLTWYDPSLCAEHPINCYDPAVWWRMGAGHDAREWYDRALACPAEYPIGTVFVITGSTYGLADGRWVCLDRGGAVIVYPDVRVHLDLLRRSPVVRETLLVKVVWP